jgi:hypothetical protein
VNITVIATGFKMSMLLPMNDLGNIILIDHDFEYNKEVHALEHGIEMSEVRSQKIGYNNADVRKRLIFEDGCKPDLLVAEGMKRSELEITAAIRRKSSRLGKREE